MTNNDLLQLLVCPESRTRLSLGEPELLLERLNQAVAKGLLKNKAGRILEARLDGVLVREDRQVAYPIVDQIPLMLADEAIPLAQLEPGA